ncbi:MAG: hypothetical protein H6707_14740 [Deltaproteobacteria bacterium]|nr:hypothetical protein [Deltaproteobacteria bacterium]
MTEPSASRSNLFWAAATLLGVFVLGAIFGAGLLRWFSSAAADSAQIGHPPVGNLGPQPLGHLKLTAEQHRLARAIGDKHRPKLERVLRRVRPELERIHQQMRRELREVLTAEQRKEFDRRPPHAPPGNGSPKGPRGLARPPHHPPHHPPPHDPHDPAQLPPPQPPGR